MKVFANTDVGLVRQLNEDDYCIAHNANDEWMAIVCDGIGGAKAGEVASHTAVMTILTPRILKSVYMGEVLPIRIEGVLAKVPFKG